jgi:hypothetical protein
MTPLGKAVIASTAIALVVAGTLMLRPRPSPVVHAQLTPAQAAEMQPAAKVEQPRSPPAPVVQANPEPDEPDFEDGNGS